MRANTESGIAETSQNHWKSVEVGVSGAVSVDGSTRRELHGVKDRQETRATQLSWYTALEQAQKEST